MTKLPYLYYLFMILSLWSCNSQAPENQSGEHNRRAQDWQYVFNGQNLQGWASIGSASAKVDDNQLILMRDGDSDGWLVSDARPADFHFKTEFKLDSGANSGVAIRFPVKGGGDPALTGYEINLSNRMDIQNPTGSIVFSARAFWEENLDPLGWNALEIQAEGDKILVLVNGSEVAQTISHRSSSGAIALQAPSGTEGAKVAFRNMEIKTMPPPSTQPMIADYMRSTPKNKIEVIFNGDNTNGWHTNGSARWMVKDGVIIGNSEGTEGGFLCTDQVYKNFYLKLKFKIALEDNSGVFVRTNPDAEQITLDEALEVNVYDVSDLSWPHPTGSVNTHARSFMGLVSYQDWNTMEVFTFDEQITVYVNGLKASEGDVPEAYQQAGKICLQVYPRIATDNGPSLVQYKDITIKDMAGVPALGY